MEKWLLATIAVLAVAVIAISLVPVQTAPMAVPPGAPAPLYSPPLNGGTVATVQVLGSTTSATVEVS